MKLVISTSEHIITSAHFENLEFATSITINTKHRWIEPDAIQSGYDTLKFIFYGDDASMCYDYVELTTEDEDERKILNRIRFLCHVKDQLWYLLPNDEILHG